MTDDAIKIDIRMKRGRYITSDPARSNVIVVDKVWGRFLANVEAHLGIVIPSQEPAAA